MHNMPPYRLSAIVFVTLLFFVSSGSAGRGAADAGAPVGQPDSTVPSRTERPLAVVGGTLVHPDAPAQPNGVVVIRGDRLAAVGAASEVEVPADADTLKADGAYVVPGLIDGHIHFFQSGGLYTRPDILDLRTVRSYAGEQARIRGRLAGTFRCYLRSGITGVVDAGGPMWNLDVRAQADTTARAPTVVTAGPLLSSVSRPSLSEGDPPIKKITTPQSARREVRRQVEAGVDLIKVWYIVPSGSSPRAYRPVVEAVVDAAAETRVAVHATQLETARAAVEAGADILVHSVFDAPIDDAFIRLVVENDVLTVPTLMVRERYRETFAGELDLTPVEHRIAQKDVVASLFDVYTLPDSLVPAGIAQRIRRKVEVAPDTVAMRNLRRLYEAGAALAAGTDAGNIGTPHGPALHREMRLMQAAGLSPKAVLHTATVGGARLMGRDDRGRLQAGRTADLLVVNADPTEDVRALARIHRVVKSGRVYAPEDLLVRTPEEAVRHWINAMNARDVDGAVAALADTVRAAATAGAAPYTGRAAARRSLRALYRSAPALHLEARLDATGSAGGAVTVSLTVTGRRERASPRTQTRRFFVNAAGKIARIQRVR
jgi:imidazolonepropionase-like amidohydrolase/limonene-1,2-epoxide hydrolase